MAQQVEYLRDHNVLKGTESADPNFVNRGGLPTSEGNLVPRFFKQLRPAPAGSGRPHIEVEMVEILIGGDNKNAPEKKVTPQLIDRFRGAYEQWKRGQVMAVDGSPLEMWPPVFGRQGLIETLKLNNVFTVEGLSLISDSSVQQLGMGALELRAQARAYTEAKTQSDPLNAAIRENEEMKTNMAAMQAQMNELAARLQVAETAGSVDTSKVAPQIAAQPAQPAAIAQEVAPGVTATPAVIFDEPDAEPTAADAFKATLDEPEAEESAASEDTFDDEPETAPAPKKTKARSKTKPLDPVQTAAEEALS